MDRTTRLCSVLALLLFATAANAQMQTISATNTVRGGGAAGNNASLEFALAHDGRSSSPSGRFTVLSLQNSTESISTGITLSGPIILANASSQLQIAPNNLVLINCDPYTGNIQPTDVFGQATNRNASGVILYSTEEAGCTVASTTYDRVYTLTSSSDGKDMLELAMSLEGGSVHSAFGMIGTRDQLGNSTGTPTGSAASATSNAVQQNPLGPSPSTAVAMIILYSITGIITALFLAIIITGAVRAHRHPERYGPRNGVGRPRQSRARGLARAMLETIPIVKFGDREEQQQPKPTEVELEEGVARSETQQREATNNTSGPAATDGASEHPPATDRDPPLATASGGIAPATTPEPPTDSPEANNNPHCSICTEDFQPGEDQRVLPCDHKFHPACVDPWLLNVSGTCPLCRIDLRPEEQENEGEASAALPPPMLGVRRSLMIGLLGSRAPERMTREERVSALRQYRDQQAQNGVEQEEEVGLRQRLRNRLRIRTRRTGEREQEERSAEEEGSNQRAEGSGNG